MRALILSLAAATLTPASANANLCIENATDTVAYFVVHPDGAERLGATLAPGEELCASSEARTGTVAVFADFTDVEGCSRRVPGGVTERLLAFPHVDLCTWDRKAP